MDFHLNGLGTLSRQVYNHRHLKMYQSDKKGFIVHNSHKTFKDGHTHIDNYNTAKYIIKLAYYKTVPKHLSGYLLVSLIRISTDKKYKDKLYIKLDKDR